MPSGFGFEPISCLAMARNPASTSIPKFSVAASFFTVASSWAGVDHLRIRADSLVSGLLYSGLTAIMTMSSDLLFSPSTINGTRGGTRPQAQRFFKGIFPAVLTGFDFFN